MEITHNAEQMRDFCFFAKTRGIEDTYVYIPTETWVLADRNSCYDKDFIEANNIPIVDFGNAGGCIVIFPNNIAVAHFSKDLENTFGKNLEGKVVEFLISKGLNASVCNNDVLIDETYKVFSWARLNYNNILYTGIHFSVTCDPELIDKVCTKTMVKIPKGLADYGITTEELLALVEEVEAGYSSDKIN